MLDPRCLRQRTRPCKFSYDKNNALFECTAEQDRFIRPLVEGHTHETISQHHLDTTPAFQFFKPHCQFKVSFKDLLCTAELRKHSY